MTRKALNYLSYVFMFLCSNPKALRHFNNTQTHKHINTHMPNLRTSYSVHRCFNRLLLAKIDNTSYTAGTSRLPCSTYNYIQRSSFKEKYMEHV